MYQKIKPVILFIFILFIISVSTHSANKKICRHCSKEITKVFIKVNGYFFHPSHFICRRCQSTIEGSTYYYQNDNFYDDSCYQIINRMFCEYCKKEIIGKYSVYQDKNYHKECYTIVSAFPCDFCQKNISGAFVTYNNKNYHETCYNDNIALHCVICLKIIEDEYMYDRYGNNYHLSHKLDSKFCNYCTGYFDNNSPKKGIEYTENSGICKACSEGALLDMSDVEPLLLEVNEKLKPYQFDIPLHKVSVHLVNMTDLKQLLGKSKMKNPQGFTQFYKEKNILGMTLRNDINIYLLKGVPKMWMIQTIAHEFNHVWQGLQNSNEIEPSLSEGSCNYVSYLVLQQYPDEEAFYLIDNLFKDLDPDYGEGFRRVVQFVADNGFSEWVNHLKRHTSFPTGF